MLKKEEIEEKLKNKGFWAGVLTAAAGFLAGSYSVPDLIVKLVQLIGG